MFPAIDQATPNYAKRTHLPHLYKFSLKEINWYGKNSSFASYSTKQNQSNYELRIQGIRVMQVR
jgi:hypothetical protein